MKFVRIHLDGYGKLVGRTFSFSPGLNLVFGPNEAGKSTLQQAMQALLYGVYDQGQISRAKQESVAAMVPWAPGHELGGSLEYELDDGRRFRSVCAFSGRPVTRLQALPGDRDVSAEYRSASHGRLFFAEQHLGMEKRVFENVCVVRQAELVALEASATAITDTLLRLSASASTETSSADALGFLDRALREQVGTDRAWTKPLASARTLRDGLEAERVRVMETRSEAWGLVRDLRAEGKALERLDVEIERLRYLEAVAERQSLQAQLDASAKADAEAQQLADAMEQWRPWADFPAHERDQVIRLDAERVRLQGQIREQAPRIVEVRRKRAESSTQLAAAEARVRSLEDARDVQVGRLPEIQRLAAQWEAARRTEESAQAHLQQVQERVLGLEQARTEQRSIVGSLVDLGSAGLAQLQEQWRAAAQRAKLAQSVHQQAESDWRKVGLTDEQYGALADTSHRFHAGTLAEAQPRRGCRFWGRAKAPPGPPPEVAIFAQVQPIHDRFESARVETKASREALAAIEERARHEFGLATGEIVDQAAFDSASRRLAQYSRAALDAYTQREGEGSARGRVQEARQEVETAQVALAQALGVSGSSPSRLLEAIQAFEAACRRKAEYDQALSSVERLRSADLLLAQEEDAQNQRELALGRVTDSLRAALAQVRISIAELEEGVRQFEQGCQNYQQWRLASDRFEAARARPATGLTQADRDRARRRISDLSSQIEAWQRRHRDWRTLQPDREGHEYRSRSQALESDRLAKRERCSQLRDALQQIQAGLRHPGELAEELADAQERIRRLERLRDVLTLAKTELESATQEFQRAFAPRLERLVAEGFSEATQGRYTKVSVDPSSLAVSVVAPERGEPTKVEQLSTGTRELLYLLLRAGISRLMSRTGESLPLLLDDPLVQLDRERQEHTLQFLASLAHDTQIVLFTKDEDTLRWYQEQLAGQESHQLLVME